MERLGPYISILIVGLLKADPNQQTFFTACHWPALVDA